MANRSEAKTKSVSSSSSDRTVVLRLSTAVWVGLVLILLALSFWGGALYGSGLSSNQTNPIPPLSSSTRNRYAVGMVVYISQSSITITNDENSLNQTFLITSKTLISINGVKSNASQIKSGNIVLIQVNKADPTKANVILVNSHFSG